MPVRHPLHPPHASLQFLDAFAGDAAWLGRYARSREGAVVPWEVIEAHKRATHPYEVFALRGMLAVPFFERALYELPEDQLSVDTLLALADRIEKQVQGGLGGRPLLSVPHILADEASCYCECRGLWGMVIENRCE
jgi:hypothetical protein